MKSRKNFRHQDRLRMLLDLGLGKASDQTVAERAKLPRSSARAWRVNQVDLQDASEARYRCDKRARRRDLD